MRHPLISSIYLRCEVAVIHPPVYAYTLLFVSTTMYPGMLLSMPLLDAPVAKLMANIVG